MKQLFLTAIFASFTTMALAGEIFVLPSSGTAILDNHKLKAGGRYLFEENMSLILLKNSKAVLICEKKTIEFSSNLQFDKKILYREVVEKFIQSKQTHASEVISGYVMLTYPHKQMQENLNGKAIAGYKGLDDDKEAVEIPANKIYPPDGAIVLKNEVELSWNLKDQLTLPSLIVIRNETDTVFRKPAIGNNGKQLIPVTKCGKYVWMLNPKSKKEEPLTNAFQKPSEAEAAKIHEEETKLKQSLEFLSPESRKQIIADRNNLIIE